MGSFRVLTARVAAPYLLIQFDATNAGRRFASALSFRAIGRESDNHMTHAALSPLIGREFDEFLGAPIRDDVNGTTLSILSALARLDVDPWREATSLARMPREAAAERLTALIDALPREPASAIAWQTSAADLVALLPKSRDSQCAEFGRSICGDRLAGAADCHGVWRIRHHDAHRVRNLGPVARAWNRRQSVGASRRRRHVGAAAQVWPLRFEGHSAA